MGGFGLGKALPPSLKKILRPAVQRCAAKNKPPKGWRVELTAHTTLDEVVDVIQRSKPGPMASCLFDALWNLRLGKNFVARAARFDLVLP
jgi:hypothetical protein